MRNQYNHQIVYTCVDDELKQILSMFSNLKSLNEMQPMTQQSQLSSKDKDNLSYNKPNGQADVSQTQISSCLVPGSIYNDIRYTFIVGLYKSYSLYDSAFETYLRYLPQDYIWNIYKQLTQDFLYKSRVLPYKRIQAVFADQVLEPLKKALYEKVVVANSSTTAAALSRDPTGKKIYQNCLAPELIPFRLCFADETIGRSSIGEGLTMEKFIGLLQKERQYTPPIRILFGGSDRNFNHFVNQYVTRILHAVPVLASDRGFEDLSVSFNQLRRSKGHSQTQSSGSIFSSSVLSQQQSIRFMSTTGHSSLSDVRVFILPPPGATPSTNRECAGNQSTLAHYLAMHDDLYCSVIYQAFCQNPLVRKLVATRGLSSISHGNNLNTKLYQMLDQSVQHYLRDACRVMNLRIYKVQIFSAALSNLDGSCDQDGASDSSSSDTNTSISLSSSSTDEEKDEQVLNQELVFGYPNAVYFFTQRFELGCQSVYQKYARVRAAMEATTETELDQAIEQIKLQKQQQNQQSSKKKNRSSSSTQASSGTKTQNYSAYKLRVEIKMMDYMGRVTALEPEEMDSIETVVAYLKVINVPSVHDLGTPAVNPADPQLLLNLIDDRTFYEVVDPDFLSESGKRSRKKIEKFKQAIQALHFNLFISEVMITVLGTVRVEDGKRTEILPRSPNEGVELSDIFIDGCPLSEINQVDSRGNCSGLGGTAFANGFEMRSDPKASSKHATSSLPADGAPSTKTNVIKRIVINRLVKNDGEQAVVPVQTFLPLSREDIANSF